ncbi:MAG: hypothetical protein AUJ85_08510 [Elusimicrobia bacterium CG1_02_37_114]|nr:MAG: hypothetical protein AUJ85_08510 [Elusimicrobia bacterium CG1_02_37_114]PIV52882.1 MAG: integration host factor subunit alpha [Elusimicrobia bacterium CG02_land_8_20_14_3_00_37_13]PIZ13656.1 MAG: integration host factor subunit alpha [Elusimicrobia bacterium CG_4_10_14_0_8_um_filter_37_32]
MKRKELLESIAQKTGVTVTEIDRVLKALVKIIQQALKSDDKVLLSGLGSFQSKKRKAHLGRNMKTGEAVKIPEGKKVYFKPTPLLRKIVLSQPPAQVQPNEEKQTTI